MLKRPLKTRAKSGLRRKNISKSMVGWRELVALPLLGIDEVKAKIDTGAKTSALHAYEVLTFKRHGREFVKFKVHPIQRSTKGVVECEAPLLEWRQVTDSSGRRTLRPTIKTTIEIGGKAVSAEITLIARDAMGFRMLIGREALRGNWLVDPSKSFIAGRAPKLRKARSEHRNFEEE